MTELLCLLSDSTLHLIIYWLVGKVASCDSAILTLIVWVIVSANGCYLLSADKSSIRMFLDTKLVLY